MNSVEKENQVTYLQDITTQWTSMEAILKEEEGPKVLADYIAAKYFDAIASKFKLHLRVADEEEIQGLAADVILELIKKNYGGIKRLDRNKGRFRGLLSRIIKCITFKEINRRKKIVEIKEAQKNIFIHFQNKQVDLKPICIDVQNALEEMEKERPLLYKALDLFYLKGKRTKDIAQELNIKDDAIRARLCSGRKWLAQKLDSYNPDTA